MRERALAAAAAFAAALVASTPAAAPAAAAPASDALRLASAQPDPAAGDRPGLRAALPPPVTTYLGDARLAGQGRLTWFGFHVYDARLYVGPAAGPVDPLRQPFVLELTYARRLRGDAIADTSRGEIERLGFGDEPRRARWLEQMRRIFPDVERDTRLAGVHQPGVGVRFYRDGRFVGAVDDPEFARAFFSIWLDERTREPGLRAQLLGAAPGASR
jgi:hypothetical protein